MAGVLGDIDNFEKTLQRVQERRERKPRRLPMELVTIRMTRRWLRLRRPPGRGVSKRRSGSGGARPSARPSRAWELRADPRAGSTRHDDAHSGARGARYRVFSAGRQAPSPDGSRVSSLSLAHTGQPQAKQRPRWLRQFPSRTAATLTLRFRVKTDPAEWFRVDFVSGIRIGPAPQKISLYKDAGCGRQVRPSARAYPASRQTVLAPGESPHRRALYALQLLLTRSAGLSSATLCGGVRLSSTLRTGATRSSISWSTLVRHDARAEPDACQGCVSAHV